MMNKILSKTVRKTTLLATIFTIILAAAIVLCGIFGFNRDTTLKSNNTVTVTVNTYAYNTKKSEIVKECEEVFGRTRVKYTMEGSMAGDTCELVFVFDKDTDVQTLDTRLTKHFKAVQTRENSPLANVDISVSAASEKTDAIWAKGFVWRSALALAALVVLVFAYAAIRYRKWTVGVATACSVGAGILLTASLIVLTRAYVTVNLPAILALAGLMTAATVVFTYGKIRTLQKEDGSVSNEDAVLSSIPAKGMLWGYGALALAVILLGIVGKTSVAWFAVSMLLALLSSVCVSLFLAPAIYLSLKNFADSKPAKNAYLGAKKSSKKKADKAAMQAETEEVPTVEEVEEAPVEETVDEEVADEE